MTKKENWMDRLERYHHEIGQTKEYKTAIKIGVTIVGAVMLVIFIAGQILGQG